MNHIIYPLLIAAASICPISSCALQSPYSDRSTLQTWNVPVTAFTDIYNDCSIDVEYTPSDRFSVTVKAPAELRKYVSVSVTGHALVVSMKHHSFIVHSDDDIKVMVTAPKLNNIRLSGSADFQAKTLSTDKLSAGTTGSGGIRIGSLTCKNGLSLQTTGSGNIQVEGNVSGEVSLRTAGSGDIRATVSATGDVGCSTTGSGDIRLNIRTEGLVTATGTGSGDIYLSGTARSVKSHSSGSGEVYSKKLNIK